MARKEPRIIKELENLEEKEEKGFKKLIKNKHFRTIVVFLILINIAFLLIYLSRTESRVYIENAQIKAPIISLSPQSPGILDRVYVAEGDIVSEGMVLAEVSGNTIKATTAGIVTSVQNTPGQYVTPQTAVVQMIDPSELEVIGQVQENKGLKDIHIGQKAMFNVDAFGSQAYYGTVDSVSSTSHASDIVFSISDQRQEQSFDVKVRYDINDYPQLKNGMSAKIWVYK